MRWTRRGQDGQYSICTVGKLPTKKDITQRLGVLEDCAGGITDGKRFLDVSDEDFGTALICAVRYSLGRRSYMPGLVIRFIRPLLPYLCDRAIYVMIQDIASPYGGYGDPTIDEPLWISFLDELMIERDRRAADAVKNAKGAW